MVSIVKADREDLDEILRLQFLAYQSEAALFGNLSNLDSFVRIEKLTENMIRFAESKLGSSE